MSEPIEFRNRRLIMGTERAAKMMMKIAMVSLAAPALISTGCTDDDCGLAVIDRAAPAPPCCLRPVTGDESVTLVWLPNREPDFAFYVIYWRFEGESGFEFLEETSGTATGDPTYDELYYVDKGLENGTTYEYIITAVDRAGNESEATYIVFDTPRPDGFNLTLYNIELRDRGGSFQRYNAYDFSEFSRTDWVTDEEADILFSHNEGLFLMEAGDIYTDIQDAGFVPLDAVDWAPEDGWSGTGTVELIVGHSYIVWTRTDNFAKFEVVDMPAGDEPQAGEYVTINWAYQEVAGLPELMRPNSTSRATRPARGGREDTGVVGH